MEPANGDKQTLSGIGTTETETQPDSLPGELHPTLVGVGPAASVPTAEPRPADEDSSRRTLRGFAPPASVASDSLAPPGVDSPTVHRPSRRPARVLAVTLALAAGAILSIAYYEGCLRWAGLGATTGRGRAASTTCTEAARAEAQLASSSGDAPASSVSSPTTPPEGDAGSEVHSDGGVPADASTSSREPESDSPSAAQSTPAVGLKPAPATSTRVSHPHRRSIELPRGRDYGI